MASKRIARKMMLFHGSGTIANNILIISAHGGRTQKKMPWPPHPAYSNSKLYMTSPNRSTIVQVSDILTFLASGKGPCVNYGMKPLFLINELTDYDLSQFASEDYLNKTEEEPSEDFKDYDRMAEMGGCDIVSPLRPETIKLSWVLLQKEIKDMQYKDIYCSFCRS